ncbi:MAG: hypothetical protein ACREVG_15790, partial [Burkholderiales bacterium]
MIQAFVTVIVAFNEARSRDVNEALDALGNPAQPPLAQRLNDAAFVHFMSMFVVPAREGEAKAHLLIEACVDGHPRAALGHLVATIPDVLSTVLEKTGITVPPRAQLGAFLEERRKEFGLGWLQSAGLAFAGTPGMSVRRILDEWRLADAVRKILDADTVGGSALAKLERVRSKIFADVDLKWAFVSEPVPLLGDAQRFSDSLWPLIKAAFRDFLWPLIPLPVLVLLYSRLVARCDLDIALWHFTLSVLIELPIAGAAVLIGY